MAKHKSSKGMGNDSKRSADSPENVQRRKNSIANNQHGGKGGRQQGRGTTSDRNENFDYDLDYKDETVF